MVGVEILSPAKGVDLNGLPNRADLERVLRALAASGSVEARAPRSRSRTYSLGRACRSVWAAANWSPSSA